MTTNISYLTITSNIQLRFATALVESEVENLNETAACEFSFQTTLPEEAFIVAFRMKIKDKVINGLVKEKQVAQSAYDIAKSAGASAGLIKEKPRETNSFEICVNVGPKEKVSFHLTYQEVLKRVHGLYKHVVNLQPSQAVEKIRVEININEPGKIYNVKVPKFSPKIGELTNKDLMKEEDESNVLIGSSGSGSNVHVTFEPKTTSQNVNGQLVVLYDVENDQLAKGGQLEVADGYFVHFFQPANVLERGSKNIVFVLDKSGSMQGRKIQQVKAAMNRVLSELDESDTFNVITFNNGTELWKTEPVPATKANMISAALFAEKISADGGTNILEALIAGINSLVLCKSGALASMIIFLTDGEATVGETKGERILEKLTLMNERCKFHIHCLGFGSDADFLLLQKISQAHKGLARRIYEDSDADLQLAGFYAEIASPLLTELDVKYLSPSVDLTALVKPEDDYTLYDGGEFVIVGKLNDNFEQLSLNGEIRGKSKTGPVSFSIENVENFNKKIPIESGETNNLKNISVLGNFIERMWAYKTVKKLLKDYELDSTAQKAALKMEALRLSLKYQFVTSLTSMVVVQDDATLNLAEKATQQRRFEEDAFATYNCAKPFVGFIGHSPTFGVSCSTTRSYFSGPARVERRGGGDANLCALTSTTECYGADSFTFGGAASIAPQSNIAFDGEKNKQKFDFGFKTGFEEDNTAAPVLEDTSKGKIIVVFIDVSNQQYDNAQKCVKYLQNLGFVLRTENVYVFMDTNLVVEDSTTPENSVEVISVENLLQSSALAEPFVEKFRKFRSNQIEMWNSRRADFENISEKLKQNKQFDVIFMTSRPMTSSVEKFLAGSDRFQFCQIFAVYLGEDQSVFEIGGWKKFSTGESRGNSRMHFFVGAKSFADLVKELK